MASSPPSLFSSSPFPPSHINFSTPTWSACPAPALAISPPASDLRASRREQELFSSTNRRTPRVTSSPRTPPSHAPSHVVAHPSSTPRTLTAGEGESELEGNAVNLEERDGLLVFAGGRLVSRRSDQEYMLCAQASKPLGSLKGSVKYFEVSILLMAPSESGISIG
eukprot:751802-Hanusia_phi.AAC.3